MAPDPVTVPTVPVVAFAFAYVETLVPHASMAGVREASTARATIAGNPGAAPEVDERGEYVGCRMVRG